MSVKGAALRIAGCQSCLGSANEAAVRRGYLLMGLTLARIRVDRNGRCNRELWVLNAMLNSVSLGDGRGRRFVTPA